MIVNDDNKLLLTWKTSHRIRETDPRTNFADKTSPPVRMTEEEQKNCITHDLHRRGDIITIREDQLGREFPWSRSAGQIFT